MWAYVKDWANNFEPDLHNNLHLGKIAEARNFAAWKLAEAHKLAARKLLIIAEARQFCCFSMFGVCVCVFGAQTNAIRARGNKTKYVLFAFVTIQVIEINFREHHWILPLKKVQ